MRLFPRTPSNVHARAAGALLVALCLLVSACGDAEESDAVQQTEDSQEATTDDSPTEAEVADDSANGDQATEDSAPEDQGDDGSNEQSGIVDLTNQVLVSTDANCGAYAGQYSSMITDVSTDTDFEGSFTVVDNEDTCSFQSNQIPNHDAGAGSRFATDIAENDLNIEVTTSPVVAQETTALGMGASVVMLNGVKWEAYPAACFGVGNEPDGREAIGCGPDQIDNPWRYNIGSPLNNFGFDEYLAHVQPSGLYHYHSTPTVLYEIDCEGTAVSPVIGFAADGFPVYGPCFEADDGTIRAAESSFQLRTGEREDVDRYTTPYVTGNVASSTYDGQFIGDHEYAEGSGDLDQCNGMMVDGQYGYYVTGSYPYVLACYSGTASNSFR